MVTIHRRTTSFIKKLSAKGIKGAQQGLRLSFEDMFESIREGTFMNRFQVILPNSEGNSNYHNGGNNQNSNTNNNQNGCNNNNRNGFNSPGGWNANGSGGRGGFQQATLMIKIQISTKRAGTSDSTKYSAQKQWRWWQIKGNLCQLSQESIYAWSIMQREHVLQNVWGQSHM